MLEIHFINKIYSISFCTFPGSLVFLEGCTSSSHIFFESLLQNKKYIKYNFEKINCTYNNTLNIIPGFNYLNPSFTLKQNLDFLATYFGNKDLQNTCPAYFLFLGHLNKKFENLTQEHQFLACLTPLFVKESYIWCVFVRDEYLTDDSKILLANLFTSKVQNSNSVVFYSTASGKPLAGIKDQTFINIKH